MQKTLLALCAALAVTCNIATAEATAQAKPGDYALHSKAWIAYETSCGGAGMSPATQDEAARKLDTLSDAELQKQIAACPKSQADTAETEAIQAHAAQTGQPAPERQAWYHRREPVYVRPGPPPALSATEEDLLRRRALQVLGQRGIEGAYSHETLQADTPPRPGCIKIEDRPDPRIGWGHARWHCPRNY